MTQCDTIVQSNDEERDAALYDIYTFLLSLPDDDPTEQEKPNNTLDKTCE